MSDRQMTGNNTGGGCFIAVDWGTSAMKAFLCRYRPGGAQELLETREGDGVGQLQGPVEAALFATIAPWIKAHGKLPLLLSGMAGSNIGWVVTPYVDCPIAPLQLLRECHRFDYDGHPVVIVPGVRSEDNDLMRGEELQILGWLERRKNSEGSHLVCLPGTHTKWVLVREGKIETFATALTGELFALLREHSVLLRKKTAHADNREVFRQGVRRWRDNPDENLIYQLFRVRSGQICGTIPERDAGSYLSGILIGADVVGAVKKFQPLLPDHSPDLAESSRTVTLLGNDILCRLFSDALEMVGYRAVTDAITAVLLAGFAAVYRTNIL